MELLCSVGLVTTCPDQAVSPLDWLAVHYKIPSVLVEVGVVAVAEIVGIGVGIGAVVVFVVVVGTEDTD